MLDIISNGRVSYVAAIGYRPVEYEMHGVDFHERGRIAEEQARGPACGEVRRTVRARRPSHPRHSPAGHTGRTDGDVGWRQRGGGTSSRPVRSRLPRAGWRSRTARRVRAGRARLRGTSRSCATCLRRTRHQRCSSPRTWTERGTSSARTSCTTSRTYARWNEGDDHTVSLSFVSTAEELRAENRSHRIVGVDEAVELVRAARRCSSTR